jgi:hypothetical protein
MTTRRSRFALAVATAMVVTGPWIDSAGPLAAPAEITRTVYFSAKDASGMPVTDLTAADLAVKEGGKDCAIAGVKAATAPMQMTIVVDDQGSGAFQMAVSSLIEQTYGGGTLYSLRVLSPQAIKVQDFTDNVDSLKAAVVKVGRRGRVSVDGDQVIAGVADVSKEFARRKAERPVIVVFALTGETALSGDAPPALGALRDSGASLSVVHIIGVTMGAVLGDGPKQSGGIVIPVPAGSAVAPLMEKLAAMLKSQYVLTYPLPDGVKPNERFSLATSRKGVTLVAPTRIPTR